MLVAEVVMVEPGRKLVVIGPAGRRRCCIVVEVAGRAGWSKDLVLGSRNRVERRANRR